MSGAEVHAHQPKPNRASRILPSGGQRNVEHFLPGLPGKNSWRKKSATCFVRRLPAKSRHYRTIQKIRCQCSATASRCSAWIEFSPRVEHDDLAESTYLPSMPRQVDGHVAIIDTDL